jgi:dynein heavy chain
LHKFLDSKGAPLPPISPQKIQVDHETVYDYMINESTLQWSIWSPESWDPPKRIKFSQLLIPTADSTRAEYIIQKISKLPVMRNEKRNEPAHNNTLLVGGPGTAKTSVILMYCGKFDPAEMLFHRMNFSSATTPFNF